MSLSLFERVYRNTRVVNLKKYINQTALTVINLNLLLLRQFSIYPIGLLYANKTLLCTCVFERWFVNLMKLMQKCFCDEIAYFPVILAAWILLLCSL